MSREPNTDSEPSRRKAMEIAGRRNSARNNARPGRRDVLRSLATVGTAAVGLSSLSVGDALAKVQHERVFRQYASRQVLADELDARSDVLAELADDGVLEEANLDLSEFTITRNPIVPSADTAAVVVHAVDEGDGVFPMLEYFKGTEEGLVQVTVLPEQDLTVASVNTTEARADRDETTLTYYTEETQDDIIDEIDTGCWASDCCQCDCGCYGCGYCNCCHCGGNTCCRSTCCTC